MPRYAEMQEFHGGLSRSAAYFFVVDGSTLRHVSEYAIQRRCVSDLVEYKVDLDRIGDKPVIRIGATNSGIICSAWVYEAGEFSSESPLGRPRMVQLSYLNGLRFSYLRPNERLFLEREWKRYYVPMLSELWGFVDRLRGLGVSVRLPSMIMCQLVSGADYPLSYLIPYSESARERSLEGLTKFIHQAWFSSRLISELQRRGAVRTHNATPTELMTFEQSSYHPAVVYESRGNVYSIWWEFDLSPFSMCKGAPWSRDMPLALREYYRRASRYYRERGSVPLRPDIVILEKARSCDDIFEYGLNVLSIFECKNRDFREWADEIETQVKPYAEIFKPKHMFLVSLKAVPQHVKENLIRRYGVAVIDEAYPGGRGEDEIIKAVEHLL